MSPKPHELFAENTRLVGYVLHCRPVYIERDSDEDRQEGYIGLLKAAEAWDRERGVPFANFACELIWRAIQQGRARRYGVDYRRATRGGDFYESPLSLDAPLFHAWEEDGFCDRLPDHPLLDDVDPVRDALILWLCDLLTERERVAVLSPLASDAANELGVTKAAVHKIRVRAYARLRKLVGEAA